MAALPLVLIAPPGPGRTRLLDALSDPAIEVLDSVAAFDRRGEGNWGVVVLGPGVASQEVLAFLAGQARKDAPWSTLLAMEEDGRLVLQPISAAPPVPFQDVVEAQRHPDGGVPLPDLHWVLRVVAKARHDLNNPLTSGLAESQLLLMGEHPDEVRESLEVIEKQFRRLRDMVADLSKLRIPRPRSAPPP